MTFLEVFDKYNLTEKEVHSLKIMKDCSISTNWAESSINNISTWNRLIDNGILIIQSYSVRGRICKVADFIHE